MDLYLKRRNSDVSAIGNYNFATGEMLVKAGAIVSKNVGSTEKFNGEKIVEARKKYCKNGKTIEDTLFSSASTAANFVTGTSTNGLIAWRNIEGKKLKEIIKER